MGVTDDSQASGFGKVGEMTEAFATEVSPSIYAAARGCCPLRKSLHGV
jgi:hypothetical protein